MCQSLVAGTVTLAFCIAVDQACYYLQQHGISLLDLMSRSRLRVDAAPSWTMLLWRPTKWLDGQQHGGGVGDGWGGGSADEAGAYLIGRLRQQLSSMLFVTPLNFYHFNIERRFALVFGAHPWHWYLSQGLPVMLGLYVPVLLWALWALLRRVSSGTWGTIARVLDSPQSFFMALGWSVLAFLSCDGIGSAHREFRFLLPLMPAVHLFMAYCLVSNGSCCRHDASTASKTSQFSFKLKLLAAGMCLSNVLLAGYMCRFHQVSEVL